MNAPDINRGRRGFMAGLAGGALLVAIAPVARPHGASAAADAGPVTVAGWVRIAADGAVTVLSNTSEIGQGTGTAIAQILANELDLDWRAVRLEMAPLDKAYFNPVWGEYATFGSGGVANQFGPLRKAGAQARAMLVASAASLWRVAPIECDTSEGQVVHRASGRAIGYDRLAAAASTMEAPADPPLMPKERWRFIGKDLARLDLPPKVDGSARYGIDVSLPKMLTAVILQSPRFGGRLASVDPKPALALRGVKQVVRMHDAVAVVADSYWHAKKGLNALKPVWDRAQGSKHGSAAYMASLEAAVKAGGDVAAPSKSTPAQASAAYEAAMARSVASAEQTYSMPFLCHAPMEPMNATARVDAGSAELWLPTQAQSSTRNAVAKELGLDPSAVTIHTMLSGGGFGRRVEYDFVLQAVRIAKVARATVKLIWSREDDMRHDFYRPAAAVRLKAGLNAQKRPLALRFDTACESLHVYSRMGEDKDQAKPVDRSGIGARPAYNFEALLNRVSTVDAGVPVGYWRAVAASQNTFAYESFMDELALMAETDPVAYRRALLTPGSRELKVLDTAVEHGQWQEPPAPGRHRGVGLVRANGSIVAQVVELSVDPKSAVKIHRITCTVDCGIAVNPKNVRAQIEGGIVYALSAAFYGEITIRDGAVEQSNFHDYRLVGLAAMPPVDVIIIDSDQPPGGVGEESVGPLAPALANALFAATGKRVRSLPLSKAGFDLV